MFSQRDEEKIITEFFGNLVGNFLDVGSYDGITFSNTHELWRRGWRGVLVEPCPYAVTQSVALYKGSDRIDIVNAAVGSTRALLPFRFTNDAVSSFDDMHIQKWSGSGILFETLHVAPITFDVLFQKFPPPYLFINIDCEAWSENLSMLLASQYAAQQLGLEMICVEVDRGGKELDQVLKEKWGFRRIHTTCENAIYTK